MTNLERKIRNVATLALITIGTVGCGAGAAPTPNPLVEAANRQAAAAEAQAAAAQAQATEIAKQGTVIAQRVEATNVAPATATRVATRPATAPAVAPAICADDGKLEYVVNAVQDGRRFIERQPIGLAAKTSIVEVGQLDGIGFAGWNRAILVVPTKGDVWQVNLNHVSTVAERSFCGKLPDVVNWAIKAHVPSLQQASRDAKGNQPSAEEIGVYRFDFERQALIVEKPSNIDLGIILGMVDVSFRQNGQNKNVPMHVETK